MKEFRNKKSFKTPEGYFEDFDERLKKRLSSSKLILPKEDGFVVPENYFDSVYEKLILNSDETPVKQLHPYRKYYYAAAAMAAIIVLVVGLYDSSKKDINFDDLAFSDIENYYDNNEIGLDLDEIAEEIPIDQLEISDIMVAGFDQDNVLEYLNNNIETIDELNLDTNE